MNNLQVFENAQFGKVRTIKRGEEILFVAADVCDALDIKNATQAVSRLDEDERAMLNIGRQGNTNVVNEFGLYNLILSSRKPEAKAFKRWVTHEVLPAIRKTGQYGAALKPATVAEVVSLVRVMRETMQAQGSSPAEIAEMAKGLGEQFNIKLPDFFVRNRRLTEAELMDMVDFIYAHPRGRGKRIPTYEDFIVHMSVKLEPKEGSEKQCKGVDKYLRDAER